MPVTSSSLIHTFTIITRDLIHNTAMRFHLDREVFTVASQEYKPASVSLAAVSISGQIRNRARNSMKIPSTSNNLIRSKLCADDDCFYYHPWRNNEVIAFGTLSSFLT